MHLFPLDKHDGNTDDEDSGTPGETEPSFASSFSVSTENLEKIGLRQKFMLENYENMDRTTQSEDAESHRSRYSISSKYHTTSTTRDVK